MPQHERVNIAVFIDFDNIEIGVKSTLGEHFDIGTILEALKERGEVVTKIAYADWTRASEYSRALTQHAIRLVQRNLTPGGDKNGADINLALDALEMAFTHPHINAYVIVGGDSDFLSLVEKLKQYDKKVFVVGGRAFTSVILQRNCHEFIAYENLVRRPAARGGRPTVVTAAAPVTQAFPIVRRALKLLADREVSPQTGLLKSTLLQLDSTFSERSYGASSFLDFVERLSQAGLVLLKHSGRSVMVELNPGFDEAEPAQAEAKSNGAVTPRPLPADGDTAAPSSGDVQGPRDAQVPRPAGDGTLEPPPQLGDSVTGARLAGQILSAATSARWPMYLRNVKQILRAADGFDERRYGFSGLIELLRALQRDGLVRMERDRRGGLRVFQGPALARTSPAHAEADAPPSVDASEGAEPQALDDDIGRVSAPADDAVESDDHVELAPPTLVDTTAELLGRAKHRRPRTRSAAPAPDGGSRAAARGTRKTGSKKSSASPKRGSRSRKAPASARKEPTE